MTSAGAQPPPAGQSDFDKLRRTPFYLSFSVLTSTAVLCTAGPPLALFAAELGLSEGQIGLLGGIMPFFQVAGLLALPAIARFGSRRVATYGLLVRYLFLCLFLLTPLFASRPQAAFALLLAGMTGFALMRAIAEAALVPWSQEFIPRSARGRIAGRTALVYVPVALLVSWLIGLWLDGQEGLGRFYPVFIIGIGCGIGGALLLLGLKGGTAHGKAAGALRARALAEPLGDRNFMIFLASSAIQYLVLMALAIFLLIYFRQLGLRSGELVFLAVLTPIGTAIGMLAAGWLVDRYGTRPIYLTLIAGQAVLLLLLPFVPPDASWLSIAAGLAFFFVGLFMQSAMSVGGVYMLNVVPPASKEAYMTLQYITVGLVGGAATYLAGLLLSGLGALALQIGGVPIDPFTVFFVLAAALSCLSGYAFYRLREEDGLSVRDFIANFSTGSPMRALVGIQRSGGQNSEERRRELAYFFGSFGSPLAKKELIAALSDPSFDVRHEAVQSLGHLAPHADVIAALEQVLGFDGLVELQFAALESLGRLRALAAAPAVMAFVGSDNPLLRARAIRSLGEMRAGAALGSIRAALTEDGDLGCRLAAVSALGKLGDGASLPGLIALYREQARAEARMSEPRSKVVLLAIAKIVNVEESFAHDWGHEQSMPGNVPPDLLARLARMVKGLPGAGPAAEDLKRAGANYDPGDRGPAWAAVLALAPQVAASRHADAAHVARLIEGTQDITQPHPALLILLIVSVRRVLRG